MNLDVFRPFDAGAALLRAWTSRLLPGRSPRIAPLSQRWRIEHQADAAKHHDPGSAPSPWLQPSLR